jgi:xanthine dehydrogenase accessory factor
VIDDREQFVNSGRFPKAAQTMLIDFLCAFDHITFSSSSYIIIATRGHHFDEEILKRSLQTPVKYIGMIGSRRKVESIYERLLKNGVSIEKLKHVYAPIGMDIGAVTPEEIAMSIVSQLIRVRRKENDSTKDKSEVMYSFFHKNDVPS